MAFVSQFIGRPVTDMEGKRVGAVQDIVARMRTEYVHPVIEALVVSVKKQSIIIPFEDIAVLLAPVVVLKKSLDQVIPFTPHESDVFLMREVLDKQIIDTDGARVVRVNDLELLRVNDHVVVSNVDVGGLGILRRIGLGDIAANVAARFKIDLGQNFM